MKSIILFLSFVLATVCALAQAPSNDALVCDCPDCREKASGDAGFSLPGLEGFEVAGEAPASASVEDDHHDHAEHEGCANDHAVHEDDLAHDHMEADGHDHAGHDHDAEGMGDIHDAMADAVDIQVRTAEGGMIARTSVFPAEIKLNRDRSAAVSPRYASVVRQVFSEIGDEVKKGDIMALLENRETLAVYTVAAPLDGVVISKDLSAGETADADRILYEVADLSTVWVDISIFPQYQHLIKKGMQVAFIAHDGHTASGTVQYISPIVSHETRTFTARCILEDAGVDFTPGAFVRARIQTETVAARVRVECAAVQSIDGESVVFVQDEHGFEPAAVETGLADGRFVEILHGLNPGDRYVATGAFTLKAELITSGMDPHAGHSH